MRKKQLDGFTLAIIEKVEAQIETISGLQRESEELYFGKKTAAELRRQGVYKKVPSDNPWLEHGVAQLMNRAPGKTGPSTEIARAAYIYAIVRFCLNELPPTGGSVVRAHQMTQILLERHGLTISVSGIRAAYKNGERTFKSLTRQSYLPLKSS